MTDRRFGMMSPDIAASPWLGGEADSQPGPDDMRETDLPQARFNCLQFAVSNEAKALWCYMKPEGRPNFSHAMLDDLIRMKSAIRCIPPTERSGAPTLEFFVLASRVPNVYNFGGDLEFFCSCIRGGRREQLRAYAYACIDALYANHTGYDRELTAIGLVQGELLGGGFEAALSCDVIIAEKHARFGLPEVRFNLFPGMGAYSFLARRLGGSKAQQLILSGKIFTATEMAELGIVDVLVETGQGEAAVKDYVRAQPRQASRLRGLLAGAAAGQSGDFRGIARRDQYLGRCGVSVVRAGHAQDDEDRHRAEPLRLAFHCSGAQGQRPWPGEKPNE